MDYLQYFHQIIAHIDERPTDEIFDIARVLTREANEWDFANKIKPDEMLWQDCEKIFDNHEKVRVTPQFLLDKARDSLIRRGYSYERTYKESDIAEFNRRLPYLTKLRFASNEGTLFSETREIEIVEDSEEIWADLMRQEELQTLQLQLPGLDFLPQTKFLDALAKVGLGGWAGFEDKDHFSLGFDSIEMSSWSLSLEFSDGNGSVSFSGADTYPESFKILCNVLFCTPPSIFDDEDDISFRLPYLAKLSFTIGGYFGTTEIRTIHVDRSNIILEYVDYEAFTRKDDTAPPSKFMVHELSLEQLADELADLELAEWEKGFFDFDALDGTSWNLVLEFSDGGEPFKISGQNAYPENFDTLLRLLNCSVNEPEEYEDEEEEDEDDY